MSEHTKKPLTKNKAKYPNLKFVYGTMSHKFDNVPTEKIESILKILNDTSDSISAQSLIDNEINQIPGDSLYKEVGFHLKNLRYRDNLSQNALSKLTGIEQSSISSIENGKRPVGKKIAQKLAKVFEVNYRIFLTI